MRTKLEAPTVLRTIFDRKIEEVAVRQQQRSLPDLEQAASLMEPARGFRRALADKAASGDAAVIAEVKKASPSKGVIREDFHPAEIAAMEMPASVGEQGPGEMQIPAGALASISLMVMASLRCTSTSAPSSHRYWTTFQVKES